MQTHTDPGQNGNLLTDHPKTRRHCLPEHRVLDGHNLEEREERLHSKGYKEEK